MAADVVDARIWEGINFRFADVRGRDQGEFVAKRAFRCFLRSLDDDDDDDDGGCDANEHDEDDDD